MSHPENCKVLGRGPLIVRFRYTNHRGEASVRTVEVHHVWRGASPWHEGEQMFVHGFDRDRRACRDYAMAGISDVEFLTETNGRWVEIPPT